MGKTETRSQIWSQIEKNMEHFNSLVHPDKNFDIIYRVMKYGGKKCCFYFIDGFCKDEILQRVMEHFSKLSPEEFPDTAHEMSKVDMPYGEIDLFADWESILTAFLSGQTVMFFEGYERCVGIDCRTYPMRGVEEPEKDRVMRGPRDGFVETLVFNTALIRRRIRSPELSMEILKVGRSSKTDIVLCYMDSRVDKKFLKGIKERIQKLDVDSLTMNQESLAECLYEHKWYNPFPKFKFSERPDAAAAHILEGNLVILVDNSPSCMILPVTIFDIIEEADDYYFPPVTGSYLRFTRFLVNILTYFITPVWLLTTMHPEWLPEWLQFTAIQDEVNVPIILQLIILEFAIDGLKLAALNTPSMLSTPLSVIAALVLGEFSVNSGWFNSETMLYMAFVAVANYTQSNYELGYALKFMRIITLVLTGLFDIYGFVAGVALLILAILTNKTLSGGSYAYPLIPFNGKVLFRQFFRVRMSDAKKRKG